MYVHKIVVVHKMEKAGGACEHARTWQACASTQKLLDRPRLGSQQKNEEIWEAAYEAYRQAERQL